MLFCRLGTVDYAEALRLQKELQAKRIAGDIGDTVLLLQHPPVLTMGRSAKGRRVGLKEKGPDEGQREDRCGCEPCDFAWDEVQQLRDKPSE